MYLNWYFIIMAETEKILTAYFFKNDRGKMPVRDWILSLSPANRKILGENIKTVEFGWPVGMPTVRPMGNKLYEVRSSLSDGSDARVLFTIYKNSMVLLHGFIKTTRKTPKRHLDLAKRRMKIILDERK
jgi:phage-related protein